MFGKKKNLKERWQALWHKPSKWYSFGLPAGGFLMFVAGIIFWGGFNTVVEWTNTEAFCISCHEMRDFVYQEYKETIHYKNTSGVRATCPDCHVPRPWTYKMKRKIEATFKELPHKILGTIDTKEKFEAHREELAESVWKVMRETDSRECRNCHAMNSMDVDKQGDSAKNKHARVLAGKLDKTCIDCHEGIAHKLPKGY